VIPESLFEPLQYVKGVGPRRAESLARAGVKSAWDLLWFLPRRHLDRGAVVPIARLVEGRSATVQGEVVRLRENVTRTGRHQLILVLRDATGSIECVFWNQRYLRDAFVPGDVLLIAGRVERFRGLQLAPEEFETVSGEEFQPLHAAGMVPVYPTVAGVPRKTFRRLARSVVEAAAPLLPDPLPEARRRGFPALADAVRAAHFPADAAELAKARERLAYDELFLLQLAIARRRREVDGAKVGRRLKISDHLDFRIRARFPFKLSGAQERVIAELRRELRGERPMHRLLQGDVGSGKTVVAAYAVLAAVGNKAQAAVMTPTEILAEQHRRTFAAMLEGSRVRIEFLGGAKTKARSEAVARITAGEADLVIGTHAVIQEDVIFRDLALAVVDEQQKFGVTQRATLWRKGARPHVLVMTATPIPRTLALALYGDLDVSVLDESPPGRKPVVTRAVPPSRRAEAMRFVRSKLKEGRQAYVVHARIDESDGGVPVQAATTMHAALARELAPYRTALLHGRMKPEEKDAVMEEFRAGRTQVLVTTLVVEVGVDVPNATVMVITDAERYGLAQLHQLRGRIVRGSHEGHCLLLADPKNEEGARRIAAMCATSDGFRIAEADLALRGPGELAGTRQSGLPGFRVADLARDGRLLARAREDAFAAEPTPLMEEYERRLSRAISVVPGRT
jgi:ATP-dependent DNA helicase RecG